MTRITSARPAARGLRSLSDVISSTFCDEAPSDVWPVSHTRWKRGLYEGDYTGKLPGIGKGPAKEQIMIQGFRTASLILLAASIAGPAFAQGPGADVYKAKCAMCHGADGLAATPMGKSMKILSFKDPAMIKASDAQLFASTKNGKGKMPA